MLVDIFYSHEFIELSLNEESEPEEELKEKLGTQMVDCKEDLNIEVSSSSSDLDEKEADDSTDLDYDPS